MPDPGHEPAEGELRTNYFGERIALTYDADSSDRFGPELIAQTVDFLAGLAGGGAALEFGIGTGRIALPLSARGTSVHGIDLSPEMLAQLRAKPGAAAVGVTLGDFVSTVVDGAFRLVYLVYNVIENLTDQDDQVACFVNAARHLEPGGCVVVEVEVPQLRRLPPGESVRAFALDQFHLGFDELEVATQRGVSHHFWTADGRTGTFAVPFRYVWPAELDLMARLAGLRLRERWADWSRHPFTAESMAHVSVWEKPDTQLRERPT